MKNKDILKKTKFKDITLEKVINFIGEKRNILIITGLSTLVTIFLIFIGYYSYTAFSNFDKINEEISKIETVNDKDTVLYVKENHLRTVESITNTINVLKNKQYTNDYIRDVILNSMINSNNKYEKEIKINLLRNSNLTRQERKNIDINKLIKSLSDKKIYTKIIKTNEQNVIQYNLETLSDSINSYISSFPKISGSKDVKDVVSKLYIYELVYIEKNIEKEKERYQNKVLKYQSPYDNFLKYVLLPNVNIWKNDFSNYINIDIFGGDYLNKAKYIDINLISYWTNFFKKAYVSRTYNGSRNDIQDIKIGKIKHYKKGSPIVYLPIDVKFGLQSDRDFYGIISKLTSTSNIKNIMLISEFTYNLWNNIKSNIQNNVAGKFNMGTNYLFYLFDNCNKNNSCSKLFGTKLSSKALNIISQITIENYNKLKKDKCGEKISDKLCLSEFINIKNKELYNKIGKYYKKSTIARYFNNHYYEINDIDKLIGARLTDCINGGYCNDILTVKTKGDVVRHTIEDFAGCNKDELATCDNDLKSQKCLNCRYKLIKRFDTNYFIAYTLVDDMNKIGSYSYISRLKDVYNNIPGLLRMGSFTFTKTDSSSYDANVKLNVYYNFISNKDLNDILVYIGTKACKSVTKGNTWSLNLANNFVNKKINEMYRNELGSDKVYDLTVIKKLTATALKDYNKGDNIAKLLRDLQIYRILKEKNYCNEDF